MIILDAILCYITAWCGAFTAEGRRLAPLSAHRLVVLACAPLVILVLLGHWFFLALDRMIYPGFRRVAVTRPLFILGIPRSGTTFLHRALAEDPAFTTTSTWELFMAPSLVQRRMAAAAVLLDEKLGSPVARLLGALATRLPADVQSVHEIGLGEAEEDYLALLPGAGCFFASLAFPQSAALGKLGDLSRLHPRRRERLLNHYHTVLQRQLYANPGRELLSKNAAFSGWLPYLAERYPDALFVLCVREPAAALSSQLSSLAAARKAFATLPRDEDLATLFLRHYQRWFAILDDWTAHTERRFLIVEQEQLRRSATAILALVDAGLDRELLPGCVSGLRGGGSRHRHTPSRWHLPAASLDELRTVHRRLLARSTRSLPTADVHHAV